MPRSHALRSGRCSIEGYAYLLTSVTAGRKRVFSDFHLACTFAKTMCQPRLWHDATRLAWVLMPDHFHLLVALEPGGTLPKLMQRIKGVTSIAVGRERGSGGLWQDGYHDHAVRLEEGIRDVARYVIANPLRAGLVDSVGDYPFWDAVWVGSGCDPLDP